MELSDVKYSEMEGSDSSITGITVLTWLYLLLLPAVVSSYPWYQEQNEIIG